MKFTEELVKNYIAVQWLMHRRDITEQRAREELLGGATIYSYECGRTVPAPLMSVNGDYMPNPFSLSQSGYCNNIVIPPEGRDLKILKHTGEVIVHINNCKHGFEI